MGNIHDEAQDIAKLLSRGVLHRSGKVEMMETEDSRSERPDGQRLENIAMPDSVFPEEVCAHELDQNGDAPSWVRFLPDALLFLRLQRTPTRANCMQVIMKGGT